MAAVAPSCFVPCPPQQPPLSPFASDLAMGNFLLAKNTL
jgi:hypothetical protein